MRRAFALTGMPIATASVRKQQLIVESQGYFLFATGGYRVYNEIIEWWIVFDK
jgi:hypothetical protein